MASEENVETPMEQEPSADTSLTVASQGVPEYGEIVVPPAPESVATYDINGPRLMITHITNENFKSYAGTQILGPFHKSFSSIVGPNGSGKSNVIDSMLFVFGYRANKIRSKKLSVLLHNSDEHRNITSCTVSVHFQKIIDTGDGDDEFDVVPGSQFVVSRTAFKDNSSYYRVDKKKVTYKEVATLLRASGIDLDHNRFLILQGEVEQISMMKPKAQTEHEEGMLEYLEDIIGSSRFKEPIEILSKRVEELNELRTEKLNRVKAVEKEKNDLEGVKNEAIEYLTKENEIALKKNMLFQRYQWELSENEKKATAKRDKVNEGMKEVNEKLEKLSEQKKEKVKEHKKIHKETEKLKEECEKKKEQFSKFEQDDVRCREDLKHAKGKAKKLEKQLKQEQQKLSELKLIPAKTESDVEELKKKLEKLEGEKEKEEKKLEEVMASLKTETQGLQAEKDSKETELLGLQKSVNETKSKMNVAQSEHELYLSNLQSEETKLRDTTNNLEKAVKTLQDRKKAIKDMKKFVDDKEKVLEKAKSDLADATNKEVEVTEKVRKLRQKVEEARSAMQATKSSNRIMEALMELKRSGRVQGIHGRLGDLGAIDEKYDIAISTACGALDYVLVENMDVAQKCVNFLKEKNLGITTFLGLEQQEKYRKRSNDKIKTPENVPRLFDLIKMKDEKFKTAFYFGVQDTLVANDLEQATRVAYGSQRYRVITLQGQLIETSGTMSGGGGKPRTGRMGSHMVEDVDPKVVNEMENQLKKESSEAETVTTNKFKLEEMMNKMQREINEKKHGIEKFSMDIESLTEQEKTLTEQKKDQEQRVKAAAPDPNKLKELESSVESFRKEYKKASDAASKVEEEVHRLHKEIMDIGGTKLKAAESRLNLVNTQVDQVMGHIAKANVAIKNANRNAKKTEDKVTSLEDEVKENTENLAKLEDELKELEAKATVVLEEYEAAQKTMKEADGKVAEVVTALQDLEEQEETLKKDTIEIRHELDNYDGVIRENQAKIKHWKKELGKLSLHKIEGQDDVQMVTYEAEQLQDVVEKDIDFEITVLEQKLAQMKPNMAAIAEYKKKEELYLKRVAEMEQVTEMRDSQRRQHENLRKQRLDEFMAAFSTITGKLKEMYQMITLGGDAELELVDSLDPFSEGIVFSVRPPKKSWKNISNLSGGEKTLSSLALVFALHHFKPTPLYVMDEIDAALDFKNVSIVANYIKERTRNAQFIIISLRNNMFELADRLIGIYKTYNCTKSVTIDPKKICMPGADDTQENTAPMDTSNKPGSSSQNVAPEKPVSVEPVEPEVAPPPPVQEQPVSMETGTVA